MKQVLETIERKQFTWATVVLRRVFSAILVFCGLSFAGASSAELNTDAFPPEFQNEAPRIRSLLEHGWAAEKGMGRIIDNGDTVFGSYPVYSFYIANIPEDIYA